MEIRLLGPVEVRADGRPIDIGGRRPHTVLAVLAAHVNQPLPIDAIIDRVWDDDPPARARHTLHGYVTRLRPVLHPGGMAVSCRNGAYTLEAPAAGVDISQVRALLDRADGPAADTGARAELLRRALALWRGEPLAGLPGSWAAATRQEWTARRLDTAVSWARAELGRGRTDLVIDVLRPIAGQYPLSEPLAEILIRALAAAGRAPEALAWYADLRRRLADELGCDPHPGLRRLHVELLRGGPAGAGADPAGPAALPAPVLARPVPAQVPGDVRGFAGRAEALRRLDDVLAAAEGEPTAAIISAVSGTAGVGKTALAVHWAHRVRDRFPDGQLYVNLRGFDPGGNVLDPADALRVLLDALGVAAHAMPAGLDARAGLYRSVMAGRRVLVVLDNARDTEQVRPLLPGTPAAVAVVTSRNHLTALAAGTGAHQIDIDVLSLPECRDLLRRRLGAEAVAAAPEAADRIITACARLPLALAVAAARARQTGLAAVAADLGDAAQRLDALDGGDAASRVRAAFSWSYDLLDPAVARLFRLLGLHPGTDFAVPAAARLADCPVAGARRMLRTLADAGLLAEDARGRFAFHDLLRTFAAEMTHRLDPEPERRAAVTRLLDYYVHVADRSARLLGFPIWGPDADPPDLPVAVPVPADRRAAIDWFTTESGALQAGIQLGAAYRADRQVGHLAAVIVDFLDGQSGWRELEVAHRTALAAACRMGDPKLEAHSRRGLALAYWRTGRHAEAVAELEQARALLAALADHSGLSVTHRNLAAALDGLGRTRDAMSHAEQSLHFARTAGDQALEARAMNAVGWVAVLHGEPEAGLAHCLRALRLSRRHSPRTVATVLHSIGQAYLRMDRPLDAVASFRESVALHRSGGERRGTALALVSLGDAHESAGDRTAAREAWQQAESSLGDVRHPGAEQARARLRDHPAGGP
ncbi:MAG TPA: BTAD domain-containing putative transcriptional regulator [Actinoplanes sp.]|nr:BTAD domain-containing putative transcriptional regulator [Actinoplanes sp.]